MNKPEAPKKPRKNESPPDIYRSCIGYLCGDYDNEQIGCVIEDRMTENIRLLDFAKGQKSWEKWKSDFDCDDSNKEELYTWFGEAYRSVDALSSDEILKQIQILKDMGAEHIKVSFSNHFLWEETLTITLEYKIQKPGSVFADEIRQHNNRFAIYAKKYVKYQEKLSAYKAYKEEKRKEKLLKELAKLEK